MNFISRDVEQRGQVIYPMLHIELEAGSQINTENPDF